MDVQLTPIMDVLIVAGLRNNDLVGEVEEIHYIKAKEWKFEMSIYSAFIQTWGKGDSRTPVAVCWTQASSLMAEQ